MRARRVSNSDREVGRRVKLRRIDLGYSQEEVGKALGVSFQQVQKYEKGINRISAGRLQQIAKLLEAPILFFFAEDDRQSISGTKVFNLLETGYSLRLMRAFSRVKERDMQRVTVELVELIADAAGGHPGKK
jgi:transcriptional regulator with XRE-family HTH domain